MTVSVTSHLIRYLTSSYGTKFGKDTLLVKGMFKT